MTTQPAYPTNRKRAVLKIAFIITGLLILAAVLGLTLNDAVLDQLKFDLNLWSLIAIVLIINILSLVLFLVLFVAYQWVRTDLKSPRVEDERDSDTESGR